MLKSGCGIEELQLEDVERLHRALAVYLVVVWRLLSLTLRARTTPSLPCVQELSAAEWQMLYRVIHRTRKLPDEPPDLQTAVLWIGRLGGFLARQGDGSPGVKVLWRGMRRLNELTGSLQFLRVTPRDIRISLTRHRGRGRLCTAERLGLQALPQGQSDPVANSTDTRNGAERSSPFPKQPAVRHMGNEEWRRPPFR